MRSEHEIRDERHRVLQTIEQLHPEDTPALYHQVRGLDFALGNTGEFRAGEEGAYILIRRYGLVHATDMAPSNPEDEYDQGFRAVIEDYNRASQGAS